MKKALAVLVIAAMQLLIVSGCAGENQNQASSNGTGGPQTGAVSGQAQSVPDQFKGKKVQESYQELDYAYEPTLENISANATHVVKAAVEGIDYITVGSETSGKEPWTILHLRVKESIKGNISPGTLDVYTYGGYISEYESMGEDSMRAHGNFASEEDFLQAKAEKQNSFLHFTFDGSTLPELSKEYVFYLTGRNTGFMPEGSYELISGEYGQMKVQADGTLQRKNYETEGKGTRTYKLAEVKNKLK